MYKSGELVYIKITGDVGMVLEKLEDESFFCKGYWVRYRTNDGTIKEHRLAEFELMKRQKG